MRIDLNAGLTVPDSKLEKSSGSRSPQESKGTGADKSQLSGTEMSVNLLAGSALQAPEIRTDKVEALKAQIDTGTYQISSDQIAAVMMEQLRA